MENRVLLAVDGSKGSARALAHVIRRSQASGARVIVGYVIEWSPYSFNTPEENAIRHTRRESEVERADSSIVAPMLAQLAEAGIEAEGAVRHGQPAEALIALAQEVGATQIVIGRRGQGGLKSLLFGSVVGNLVQTAPVPVVVVP